ncbi:MAG: hypothetical protein RR319_09665 [Bacteroides sp.]
MKKIASLFISVCVMTLVSCGSSKSIQEKVYSSQDEINEKMAEYTNGGWQIHGTSRTLRGKLTEHYDKMKMNLDLYELIGTSTGCRSITVCRASALNAACIDLATKMGQDLKGKTMRDMGVDESAEVPTEYNKFQDACISKFQASIKEDLVEDFAMIRKEGGVNSYEIYFFVDKSSVNKKRKEAIEVALKESDLHQAYARSIEKFINDGEGVYE